MWKLEIADTETCIVAAPTLVQAIEVYCKQTGLADVHKLIGCSLLNNSVLIDRD